MNSRALSKDDIPRLQKALDRCQWHPGQKAEAYQRGIPVVYEEDSPVIVFRFTKALRVCAAFFDENDSHRNGAAIAQAIEDTIELAKENGYTEIIFETHNEDLAKFCDKFGFEKSEGEYVKHV